MGNHKELKNYLTPERFCNKQNAYVSYKMMFYCFSPLGVKVFVYPKQLARSDVICPDASDTCQTEV